MVPFRDETQSSNELYRSVTRRDRAVCMRQDTCNLVYQVIRSIEAGNRLAPDRFAIHTSIDRIRTNLGGRAPDALELVELLGLDARFVVSKLGGLEEYVVSLAR